MVKLNLRAQSIYGKNITKSLKATERALNVHCSCPPGQSCSVEVNELARRQFEVVVTRPAPVSDAKDWAVLEPAAGKYRRLFDRRASADRIVESVSRMVAAPLMGDSDKATEHDGAPDDIVLVDSMLVERVERLVIGCHMCSPFAEVPLFVVLDHLRDAAAAKTHYVFEEHATCSRCQRPMTEHTLVDMEAEF